MTLLSLLRRPFDKAVLGCAAPICSGSATKSDAPLNRILSCESLSFHFTPLFQRRNEPVHLAAKSSTEVVFCSATAPSSRSTQGHSNISTGHPPLSTDHANPECSAAVRGDVTGLVVSSRAAKKPQHVTASAWRARKRATRTRPADQAISATHTLRR
ncbi:hypothetical protein CC79DRAFT_188823 [Sarocladium strictum]